MISLLKRSLAASAAALVAVAAASISIAAAPAAANTTVASTATGGDCGSIDLSSADAASIAAATSCFHQAFSACQSAQLRATWQTSDATIQRLVSVSPGDYTCMVVESVTRTPKASGTDSSDDFRCAGVSLTDGGLVLNRCGADGDVRIVAASH